MDHRPEISRLDQARHGVSSRPGHVAFVKYEEVGERAKMEREHEHPKERQPHESYRLRLSNESVDTRLVHAANNPIWALP